ncbi:class I SAM-dependent methyltransferase [Leptospira idonii]|uniref:Class I SAM-dependent methyltransferase n=1 Tax=Leptospira idonii TaxID=1193500 RepID=A0A4R9LUF1_9LEPT|nr:class I SAM-dependent methyltransferase [Leptospira idonii]TGN17565.1 class I SAM-dependent methyltransferase [Leptospira idonii]
MEMVVCNTCEGKTFSALFSKQSPLGEEFHIVKCKSCGLVQVNPQPSLAEVIRYYSDSYFTQRTDRGYDNYYSDAIRSEISRVFQLNLTDLKFFEWEKNYKQTGASLSSLDIGCAAGYFVDYMRSKGYRSEGIEVADGPVRFAREKLGLTVHQEDFLSWDKGFQKQYDVITLWATIEHLHKPKETLEKIYRHLKPGGCLVLSTCRYGILARWKGPNWRYLNVPEHLYYYSLSGLLSLLKKLNYKSSVSLSYGSGLTSKPNAGFLFRMIKKIADPLVKKTNQGDMMAILTVK